jgi:hypothetical protein
VDETTTKIAWVVVWPEIATDSAAIATDSAATATDSAAGSEEAVDVAVLEAHTVYY